MVKMNEQNIIRVALAASAFTITAGTVFLFTIQSPGIRRIPVPEIYSQGIATNYYVNNFLPIVIVLAILFIAGLSTFGLYHGATRELLGKRPLITRPIAHIRSKISEK